ncbi:MAG: hypothetical protein MI723_16645, partial [Caulobacterales bacterium]|nr:hypothetical protein [Caulobacterales bacterium]
MIPSPRSAARACLAALLVLAPSCAREAIVAGSEYGAGRAAPVTPGALVAALDAAYRGEPAALRAL